MNRNLANGTLTTVPIAATAAGTTAVNGASQYMGAGSYSGVKYTLVLGALTATQVTSLKAQGSLDNATWVDLAGTNTGPAADGDGGKTLILDLFRPGYPYVRPVVLRATANAAIQCVIAEQYLANIEPVTPDSTNSATKTVPYAQTGTP